jgi:hypothetical protein
MKTHRVTRAADLADFAGTVLCHDVGGGSATNGAHLRKGQILGADDVQKLGGIAWDELHVIELEPGEIPEREAGSRLADVAAGDGVVVRSEAGGHWPLASTRRGILDVPVEVLRRVNSLDGVSVYTLFAGQIVDAEEQIAQVKIIPFVLDARLVDEAARLARDAGGLIRVRPFVPHRVGAVVHEAIATLALERFREALTEKLGWFGSSLLPPVVVTPDETVVAKAIDELTRGGAQAILLAGTKAMDPLDASFGALARLGVTPERVGVPAHPGSLLWIAWRRDVPIIGMPTCGLFSKATVLDLVLPRVLAGERVGRAELAELGHGGLLTRELTFRFPPYRGVGALRGALEEV